MTGNNSTTSVDPSEISNIKSTNRLLIILLIVASFFLGSLTNKVSYLENSGPPANAPSPKNQETTIKKNPLRKLAETLGFSAKEKDVPSEDIAPKKAESPSAITTDTIKKWAKELGLNTNSFDSCLDSDKYKNAVDEDMKAGQTAGVNGTPTFFINGTILVGAQPFEAFKTIIDKELAQGSANSKNTFSFISQSFAQESPDIPTLAPKVSVENGHFPAFGDINAKVKIIEFSDFECPFCRRYFTETFPQIKKDYIDTGKVIMYYRHYPLPFHPLAQPFAIASECANEQDKFWEFHDKIFKEQG